MLKIISATICALLLISNSLGFPTKAQDDRRRSSTALDAEPMKRDEERAKILEECVTADRPMPEVEKSMAKNWLLCGKAISLPKPAYPSEAKEKRVSGFVAIEVVIDENGQVIWAKAAEGPAPLQPASVRAACQARFSPIKISGRAVKAHGTITYNFVDM